MSISFNAPPFGPFPLPKRYFCAPKLNAGAKIFTIFYPLVKQNLLFCIKKRGVSMIYAYARVSSREQNLTRQLDSFSTFGIEKKYIYSDKKSGKDFERINYLRLLKKLKAGDLLVIKSIDRLGRNYNMIIEEWSRITKQIGADILVLDMPLLDTRDKENSLVGKFISDIVLQILSFVAENERENIRARQREGIAAAKRRGVRFGRPTTQYTAEFIKTANEFYEKRISLTQALSETKMSAGNFYYHCRRALGISAISRK